MALISFVFVIYKYYNEDVITLFSINMALIHSIVIGIIFFAVFALSNRKHWRKVIEDDNTEKTKLQKVFPIISGSFGLIALVSGVLYFNNLPFANIVFWGSGAFCFIALVVMLILKRKKK